MAIASTLGVKPESAVRGALFGKSDWFLVLAAAGAPIFFLLLLFLAVRERFQAA